MKIQGLEKRLEDKLTLLGKEIKARKAAEAEVIILKAELTTAQKRSDNFEKNLNDKLIEISQVDKKILESEVRENQLKDDTQKEVLKLKEIIKGKELTEEEKALNSFLESKNFFESNLIDIDSSDYKEILGKLIEANRKSTDYPSLKKWVKLIKAKMENLVEERKEKSNFRIQLNEKQDEINQVNSRVGGIMEELLIHRNNRAFFWVGKITDKLIEFLNVRANFSYVNFQSMGYGDVNLTETLKIVGTRVFSININPSEKLNLAVEISGFSEGFGIRKQIGNFESLFPGGFFANVLCNQKLPTDTKRGNILCFKWND